MNSNCLTSCIGAIAGTIFTVASAQASIVYSGPLNVVIPNSSTGLFVNVDGGFASGTTAIAGWDINISGIGVTLSFAAPGGAQNFMRLPGVTTGSAGNLPISTPVDGLGSYGAGVVTFGASPGGWNPNGDSYFGFRFNIGSATHYGWGRINVAGVSAVRTLRELAYEDAEGVGIPVGTVPGPASAALLGLAGFSARRRRQR